MVADHNADDIDGIALSALEFVRSAARNLDKADITAIVDSILSDTNALERRDELLAICAFDGLQVMQTDLWWEVCEGGSIWLHRGCARTPEQRLFVTALSLAIVRMSCAHSEGVRFALIVGHFVGAALECDVIRASFAVSFLGWVASSTLENDCLSLGQTLISIGELRAFTERLRSRISDVGTERPEDFDAPNFVSTTEHELWFGIVHRLCTGREPPESAVSPELKRLLKHSVAAIIQ